jgi:hypothetical protein
MEGENLLLKHIYQKIGTGTQNYLLNNLGPPFQFFGV